MTYFFETYGCQMNSAESAALVLDLKERNWVAAACGASADLVIINTCSVRVTAEKRAFGRIAHYASIKKKLAKAADRGRRLAIVVAGCMAQRLGEGLKEKYPEVDYVMGTSGRSMFPVILQAAEEQKEEILPDFLQNAAFSFSASHLEEGQFRSFVPIMHGCNNFCSYCIVPYVRGSEVSRSPKSITEEIRLVGQRGVREITLLGQNVNSYNWKDNDGTAGENALDFSGLLELAAEEACKNGIRRLRFLSANPKNFSAETIKIMAKNPIFCRHLHLPVQHGSNSVLKAMNRGYTKERYLELVGEIRSAMPGITISTDILVGFPGETEACLEQTLELMEKIKFIYAFMYHFNPREGTAAWDLPNRISEDVKKQRLAKVIDLQKKHTKEMLKSRIGSVEQVLVEGISKKNADELITRTEKDEMVVVPGSPYMIGAFAELTLSSLRGNTFRAKELIPCHGA